jgi:adenosylcobinamide-GDP ribazoletransferase
MILRMTAEAGEAEANPGRGPGGWWRELRLAAAFLSRLPVPLGRPVTGAAPDSLAAATAFFPLIGALLGALAASVYALATMLGLPPWPAAILAVGAGLGLTGALHEDGLADLADGFGGGRTPEDKLRIMRDSRLGSFGAAALFMALALRISTLAALGEPLEVALALILAGAASRAALPLAMAVMPQARAKGLAADAGRPGGGRVLAALIIAAAIGLACRPHADLILVYIAGTLAGLALLRLARRQIGGITGDVLGALQQVTELAVLLALLALALET